MLGISFKSETQAASKRGALTPPPLLWPSAADLKFLHHCSMLILGTSNRKRH